MLRFKKYSLIVVLSLLSLHGQRSKDMEKFGFIDLKTDSMDVPFYIDGIYVGKNPLPGPILDFTWLVTFHRSSQKGM